MFMLQHLLATGSRSSVHSCYLCDYQCLCCSIYWVLVVAVVFIAFIYEIIDVYVAASTGFW